MSLYLYPHITLEQIYEVSLNLVRTYLAARGHATFTQFNSNHQQCQHGFRVSIYLFALYLTTQSVVQA
jgi:hypothetical protein